MPSREPSVCAVVVTYNRASLLAECLDRLEAQTRPVDHVLVVDNASTDETADVLDGRPVEVLAMDENLGGAGGFARGVDHAHAQGHDWLWLLDDDTMAEPGSLAALLEGGERAPSAPLLLTSVVRWKDGTLHPMNRPWLRLDRRGDFAEAARAGLAAVRGATFVSTLIHRDAVTAHGLPPAHFFIWQDDIEFTTRVLRDACGYLVPESVVWHWTPRPYNTLSDSRDRFYFKARNQLWILRGESFRGPERLAFAAAYARVLRRYVRESPDRRAALRVAWRGVRDGLGRIPA